MNKRLIIDAAKCTGCGMCQLICAFSKSGWLDPSISRIKVYRDEVRGLFVPMVCQQCDNPPCAQVCLMNVISKEKPSGITVRRLDGCIDCRLCQMACPFEGCQYDYHRQAVVNCDLCNGSPQCAAFCAYGAIQFISMDESIEFKRSSQAARRAECL